MNTSKITTTSLHNYSSITKYTSIKIKYIILLTTYSDSETLSSNLFAFVSPFTAECWAILEALTRINFLPRGDFLIVSDSQASILEIANNSILSKLFSISFLWAPGHIGINGNKHADLLAGSTANQSYLGPLKCPYTDLVNLHHSSILKLWKLEWNSLPESYAFGYRLSALSKLNSPDYARATAYYHIRCSFKLGLNNSTYCPLLNCGGKYCDFQHLLINCPSLSIQRSQLKILFSTSGINSSVIDALSTDKFHF
ncbi:RNase H domain-containing protein [Aphis craccivora]|uniref:RNase H domain-containing protein n=1 Tax=Aphis craccivora TaxID=307492 RepID=A0A6G0ZJJ5_APHCR|nr:RNase H domain-containing protein [Aphis craccivora]